MPETTVAQRRGSGSGNGTAARTTHQPQMPDVKSCPYEKVSASLVQFCTQLSAKYDHELALAPIMVAATSCHTFIQQCQEMERLHATISSSAVNPEDKQIAGQILHQLHIASVATILTAIQNLSSLFKKDLALSDEDAANLTGQFCELLGPLRELRDRLRPGEVNRPRNTKAKRLADLAVGDTLIFRDGKRGQIIEIDRETSIAILVVLSQGKIKKEVFNLEDYVRNIDISGYQRAPCYLLPGATLSQPQSGKRWEEIRVGDIIIGRDEDGVYHEEILELQREKRIIYTTSLVSYRGLGKVLFRDKIKRGQDQDTLAGLEVIERRALSQRCDLQTRFRLEEQDLSTKGIVVDYAQLVAGEIEALVTEALVTKLGSLLQNIARQGEAADEFTLHSKSLARALDDLDLVIKASDAIISDLNRLSDYCKSLSFEEVMRIADRIQSVYSLTKSGAQAAYTDSQRAVATLLKPLNLLADHLSKVAEATLSENGGTENPPELVAQITELRRHIANLKLQLLEIFLSEGSSHSSKNESLILKHHRFDDLLNSTLITEIHDLIATAPREIEDSRAPGKRGIVINSYSRADIVELFSKGLECITLSERNGKLLGAALFYPKGVYSSSGEKLKERVHLPNGAQYSELDLIIIHPDAQGKNAFPILMHALLLHVKRLGMQGAFSEMINRNHPSLAACTKYCLTCSPHGRAVTGEEARGDNDYWATVIIPLPDKLPSNTHPRRALKTLFS